MSLEDLRGTVSNDSCCPDLSLKTRMIGFVVCCIIAIIFSVLSCMYIGGLFSGSVNSFVIAYSLGTAFSIAASFFLKGPKAQWNTMTDKKRFIPSMIFLVAFIMTFISVYLIKSNVLTIICVVVQICAGLFYMLTFVPYGTSLFKKCCRSIFCCEKENEMTTNML